MPKTATKRNQSYVTKSSLSDDVESSGFGSTGRQTRGNPREVDPRNIVGDEGVKQLKKRGQGVAVASDDMGTPTSREAKRAAEKAAMDKESEELLGKVKKAMSKKGGALVRSNYDD